jgi:L,D-transpeptidase catalytic domain
MRWAVGLMAGLLLAAAGRAEAAVLIAIDKSAQTMTVLVDGGQRHVWKVSTGTGGGPKSGTYRPERMERKWFSRKYGMSPMPHAIFFHEGYAIHGTIYVSRLGQRASHGCVRLHPDNAAILFELVKSQDMSSATIIVANAAYVPQSAPVAARIEAQAAPAAPVVAPQQRAQARAETAPPPSAPSAASSEFHE